MGQHVDKMDAGPLAEVEKAVGRCEDVCDCEIVVVIAESSGPYRDVRILAGILLAMFSLLFIVFWPYADFSPWVLLLDLLVFFAVGYFAGGRSPLVLSLLTSGRRRKEQVHVAADLAFHQQNVSLTRRRTGILVYLSLFEGDACLVEDVGIRRALPGEILGDMQMALRRSASSSDPIKALVEFIDSLTEPFSKYVPTHDSNPDELPNTPIWLAGGFPWR